VPDSINATFVEPEQVVPDRISRQGDVPLPRSAAAAVDLTAIAHRLGNRWALRGITLRVDPAEVVAIVGPNGSGKTTLLRVLATSLPPTRGSGTVFGYDLLRQADDVRAAVAMLGHGTGLYDDLSAAENLRFAMRMLGDVPSAVAIDGVLETVGMRAHARELVRSLSSGMRRRIALARLFLRRPRLLLLDEPYNTFDPAGVELVDSLIRQTAASGGAALVVTHDLGRMAAARYDRVVTLQMGRVSADLPPSRERST
jgi:heme ABC exporter ATP-binding subunit CcmA